MIQSGKALRHVVFDLQPDWENEVRLLAETLKKDGISCTFMAQGQGIWELAKFDRLKTIVLTDSAARGKELARMGIVYFGCSHTEAICMDFTYTNSLDSRQGCALSGVTDRPKTKGDFSDGFTENRENKNSDNKNSDSKNSDDKNSGSSWFDGAALVLEGFEEVDARYLEEWMLRAQGLPAVIARTERLEIREMTEQDLPELIHIGNESGAVENLSANADVFSEERLSSYIKTAYRLQGYGLWSVLYEGKLIGCCGFAPWDFGMATQKDFAESGRRTASEEGSAESGQLTAAREDSAESGQLAAAREDPAESGQLTAAKGDSAESGHMKAAALYMTFRLDLRRGLEGAERFLPGTGLPATGLPGTGIPDGQDLSEPQNTRELPEPKTQEAPEMVRSRNALELQYMLDCAYRRQGFGTEMCRAALAYAYERLDADEIYLRIQPDNQASRALAKKLHFSEVQDFVMKGHVARRSLFLKSFYADNLYTEKEFQMVF
ncbi:MAG: GNAT family N-acetyltransferase [Lachnospiraceae bacterium]|nr:GNAT family N-acetyltransferase [Lachnospiraceae bacterium]